MQGVRTALAATVCALALPAATAAQDSAITRPAADFMQRGGETARYAASGAAATRSNRVRRVGSASAFRSESNSFVSTMQID